MYSHLLQWCHQQAVNQSWQWFNYRSARVRIPYGTLLTWNKGKSRNLGCVNVNVCPESFSCQQTWKLWGEMRCYTWARTRPDDPASFWVSRWNQLLVPDVDCKYPAAVFTTRVGLQLALHSVALLMLLTDFSAFMRTLLICCITKQ